MRDSCHVSDPRWFGVHVAAFVGGVVLAGAGVCGGWTPGIPVAGALLLLAGAGALVARRSVVVPRGLRAQADYSPDAGRRADVERAGAIMSGIVLLLCGLVLLAIGVSALAR